MAKPAPRTAFVTGASSGIGAALAQTLAARGVEVAIAARRPDALRSVADTIERAGGKVRVVALDVTKPDAVVEVMRQTDATMGGIDLVVANAGVAHGCWSGKLQWSDCDNTLAVNVLGATATLTALLPAMLERKCGHLVGISSIAAYRGLPKYAVYSASKAYLSTFLEALRVDLRRTAVHVTDIRPGYVRTEMNAGSAKLPMEMSAEAAAETIARAILAGKARHAFPMPIAGAMATMAAAPNAIYDRVMGR